jgi:hypothetical protein
MSEKNTKLVIIYTLSTALFFTPLFLITYYLYLADITSQTKIILTALGCFIFATIASLEIIISKKKITVDQVNIFSRSVTLLFLAFIIGPVLPDFKLISMRKFTSRDPIELVILSIPILFTFVLSRYYLKFRLKTNTDKNLTL